MPWVAKNSVAERKKPHVVSALLIGQHLGIGHARVVVDSHVQGQEAGMLFLPRSLPSARRPPQRSASCP